MTAILTIGKLARRSGVGVETVRFYERKRLIEKPLKPIGGGYRQYSLEDVNRIRFVRQAQDLGFSLREIGELLSLRTDPEADCADVRGRARKKLAEVERKIARLNAMRRALSDLVSACPGRGGLLDCSIIDALEQPEIEGEGK